MRIELRSPDPSCNPFLPWPSVWLLAWRESGSNSSAGPGGSEQPQDDGDGTERAGIEALPRNLEWQSFTAWRRNEYCDKVLGRKVSRSYCEAKRREWEEYCTAGVGLGSLTVTFIDSVLSA